MTRARGWTARQVYTVRTSTGVYQYRGDPTGPPNARSLRLNGGRWRKGTVDEWRVINWDRRYPQSARAGGLQEGTGE